jgi:nucleotidyltransferase substrate binding protein (TIGR01987 family)
MEKRLAYILEQLSSAVSDFENALTIDESSLEATIIDTVHNGQAQKFEFSIELFWKSVKVFLFEQHGLDIASPKGVVKKYFELGYVEYDGCERLLRALDIRNSLSHVYKKEAFIALYEEICSYKGFFASAISGMMHG